MDWFRQFWYLILHIVSNNNYKIIAFQYFATCVLAFLPKEYWCNYYLSISNFIGYSLLSNLFIAPKIWKENYRFTEIVKAMVFSMIISNLFSILAIFVTYDYYTETFDKYFLTSLTAIVYMYYFKKKRKNERYSR